MATKTTPPVDAFERDRLALFARYGFEAESRWVGDREGRVSNLLVRGDGAHPTVLLHGGLSQAAEWAPLAGRLPGHVVIPDRPGCGLSYPVDYRGVDYGKAAEEWLSDLLDGIDAEQVDLVGNSMGGFFGIAFADAHPDRVRRLILVGAPAGLDRQVPLLLRLWGNPLIGPILIKAGLTTPRDGEALRERVFARLLVAHPEDMPRDILELAVAAQALPGVERSSHTMLRAVSTLRGWRRGLMMRDGLAGLRVPTRFLWGDADGFAPPSSGMEMVARMLNAAIDIIPDTGHLPHLERPDAVANAIADLAERDRNGSAIGTGRGRR